MPNAREKLIDIVEAYADFLDWDTKEEMVDSIMEFLATDNNVGHKWIPVTERLPELHTKVLCCGVKGGRFIAETSEWGEGNLYWTKRDGKGCSEVTHWMPLPQPPKGE